MAKSTQLIDNEVFRAFATYTTIVLLKMMLMSLITAYFRITRKAFVNPEDTESFGKGESAKKFLRTDPDVERVRRFYGILRAATSDGIIVTEANTSSSGLRRISWRVKEQGCSLELCPKPDVVLLTEMAPSVL